MKKRKATNPYAAPHPLPSTISDQLHLNPGSRGIFWCATIFTGIVWALHSVEELPVRKFLQSYGFLSLLILFFPVIIWSSFCHQWRPSEGLGVRVATVGATGLAYMYCFLLCHYSLNYIAGKSWANLIVPSTPQMQHVLKHAVANFFATTIAAVCVAPVLRFLIQYTVRRT